MRAQPSQHFTAPPPRYSEGGLVKRLEQLGIGRPSTYAVILKLLQDRGHARLSPRLPTSPHLSLELLQDRGYAELVSRSLRPLPLGQMLTALLTSQLERYANYEYTARQRGTVGASSVTHD